ncbi:MULTISPECIES: ArsR/SmtB family transcription factor [unclassified Candidatus Frackibacter]|uniref:ArsR/SmtB family transcription factor n=1 Tax=unclassified Candidatus Frackibacter TaxID=2648818 RepID=UPI0007931B08|nr:MULTISPECIES: metalloregulator ArsR/SmtB family transcription factor [unclassified Candidatus Frackibacter]KXS40511.1 MAG: putative transcriptional regulator [Candidatus Frackibacter sp. T328-2]SDC59039.1 DNA-binding transcriptional regulator, ArsR family [Candidatus Frackibacter sp. WG11]SEM42621.1 DNA-binding transcriptional regulator, ArsR family [Candidatus Frackibacter sp. WG12]SFL85497.1 DNA-binding transcriptional regulator, ArsR family [Candidatus Frackibacter sp. WG13]
MEDGDKDILTCQEYCPNFKNIKELKNKELSEDIIQKLAATFKVLGDPTRIKIINILANKELCVCDISELLDMTQSAISHQLRKLRDLNLVKYRKEGRVVYYSLDDHHILQLFNQGLEHVMEDN